MRGTWIVALVGAFVWCTSNVTAGKLQTERPKVERSLCETPECKELAKLLTESMNQTVDPCEDFYEYVCGNWPQHNPLPKEETHWNLFYKVQKLVNERLQAIAEEGPKPEDYHAVKVAKQAFSACLDTDEMDKQGLQPLISTMWRVGGWPLIMEEAEWDEKMYRWQNIDDYYALLTGANTFHDTTVDMNYMYQFPQQDIDWKFLQIRTPHLPVGAYGIYYQEPKNLDSSDENNDNDEGSQERGSNENREGSGENREDHDGSGDDTEDDEGEFRIQIRKRINASHNTSLQRSKNSVTMKHSRKPTKIAKKKDIIKLPNRKHSTLRTNKRIGHNIKQLAKKSFEYKLLSKDRSTNSANNEKQKNYNIDWYFDEDQNENENEIRIDKTEKISNYLQDYIQDSDDDGSGKGSDDEDGSGEGSGEGSGMGSGDDDNDDDYDDDDDDDDISDSVDDRSKTEEEERKAAEKKREKYAEYIFNVSKILSEARGVPIPEEKLKEDIADLVQFQIDLLKSAGSGEFRLNATLKAFQEAYETLEPKTPNSKVNWLRKVQDLFSHGGMEIDANHHVVVPSMSYFKNLFSLLNKTPSRTLVNYIHWRFVNELLRTSTEEMRTLFDNWENWMYGGLQNSQRIFRCIYEVRANHVLGYEYVKRYFPDKILQTALDMVDDIQKEVEHEVKKSPWLDDETREIMLEKLMYMKRSIGYSDVYRNDTIMKEYLTGLSVSNSHMENSLSIAKYYKMQVLRTLFKEDSPFMNVDINPLIVNAFFSAFENNIEITAADFQKPFFDYGQPWYTNYGIIGLIMSHEVNHGFDNLGREFNKDGSFGNWSSEMDEAYEKRAKCFMDQFTKYSVVDNKTANVRIEDYGKQTAPENIADSMGLQAIFKAYQRRERTCETPDPMLPGLEHLSNEQLFFVSFAYLWCEVADPEKYQKLLKRDSHSPGPLRVIGAVSNSEDFAKVYNCPVGSPMNPKNKCNIWH